MNATNEPIRRRSRGDQATTAWRKWMPVVDPRIDGAVDRLWCRGREFGFAWCATETWTRRIQPR
jgi:hypothetical protein